jgi:LytS/YehU family sensor histidine kinase
MIKPNEPLGIINAFVEDTCVIIVVAYLLARGRLLVLLFQRSLPWRQALTLGVILGFVGLTEAIFPGLRLPYVTSTLIVMYAGMAGGMRVGLIAAAVVGLLSPAIHETTAGAGLVMVSMLVSAVLAAVLGRAAGPVLTPFHALGIGIAAQTVTVLIQFLPTQLMQANAATHIALTSIPANGFGMLLLQIVVRDAQARLESDRHRTEAEQAQALIAEAKLTALRARIHPHFLFNALTSIAALCSIAPDRAETAIIRLSQQMRRALNADPNAPLCLCEELEQVTGYLEIEQLRLGSRLTVQWEVDPACAQVLLPAFGVQTLVENAVGHGIAPAMQPCTLRIVVRRHATCAVIAVVDTGVGILPGARPRLEEQGSREHGLQILARQLVLLYGRRGRLRLISRADQGTIAAFAVPFDTK